MIERLLGREWGGVVGPPDDHLEARVGEEREIVLHTEYGVLYLGWAGDDSWTAVIDLGTAKEIAWFVLWDWCARARWFGLRTALYSWAFRRSCRKEAKRKVHARARIEKQLREPTNLEGW